MAHHDRMTMLPAEEPVEDLSAFDLGAVGPGFVLAVNPGSLSTKLAIGQRLGGTLHFHEEELSHDDGGSTRRGRIARRMRLVLEFLEAKGAALSSLRAICVRGGFLHPTAGGLIRLNELRDGAWRADARVLDDLEHAELEHPSNYGIPIALGLIEQHGLKIPAFTLDPVTTDQMEAVARYAGKKGFVRRSIFHALNVFAASRVLAGRLGKPLESLNLLVCHLGGGTSVVALRRGRAVDVNNALLGEAPFTPQRGVPQLGDALDYAVYLRERGARREEILFGEFAKNAGLRSYTGTADLRELEARIADGDAPAAEALRAMAYQIVKALGAMAAALGEPADALLITGGGARSQVLLDAIDACIGSGALDAVPVYVLPGALEQYAMVEQTLRLLDGEVAAAAYEPQPTVESPRPIDRLADLLEAGKQLVREHPKTIALCAPNDESLEALRDAHEDGIIRGAVLIGEARAIEATARGVDLDLNAYSFRILDVPQRGGALDHTACAQAAVRAVREGPADMLVKGVVSTGAMLRAVLDKESGITRGERLTMSCVTYLPRHDRLVVFADPGINTETDDFDIMVEEVRGALKLAGYLDMVPRVAFLSAIERPTPRIPSTLLAEQLAAYFTEEAGHDEHLRGAAFQGPLSLDLALDPEVAADKACAGEVVGRANVLIFPNIESANAFYKFVTQIEPSRLIATAIPGTTAPCVISSRGDSEANRMASLVLGAYLEELYQRRLKAKAG